MPHPNRDPSRFALVIGINEYANVNPLGCCVRDAQAMAELLTDVDRGIVDPDNLIELYDSDATADSIRAALAQLAKWADHPEDTVWIYYSGHGAAAEDDGETFLVAHDADDRSGGTFVSASEFREAIQSISATRIVVALDCCHAGGFTLRTARAPAHRDAYSDRIRRLLDRFSGSGRFIIASCNADETSIEINGERHGLFTRHLLDGLRGQADSDGNGVITPNELVQYLGVVEQQAAMHGHQQVYQFDGAFGANFVLVTVPGDRGADRHGISSVDPAEIGTTIISRNSLRLAPEPILQPRELKVSKRSGFFGFGGGFESMPALDAFAQDRGYIRRRPEPLSPLLIPRTTSELSSIGEGSLGILEYRTDAMPCVLRFTSALQGNGFAFDLTLEAHWRITDFNLAASALLRPLVSCADSVTKREIDALLQANLQARIVDIVRENSLDAAAVRNHHFAASTWTERLVEGNPALSGFELIVAAYSVDSPEERAALAKQREIERAAREQQIAEIRLRAAADHESRMIQVQRAAAEAEARGEEARLAAQRKRELEELEHQKRVMRLELELQEIKESRAAERLQMQLDSERAKNEAEIHRRTEELAAAQEEKASLRAQLEAAQAKAALRAAKDLTPSSPAAEFGALYALGVSPTALAGAQLPLAARLATRASTRRVRLVKRDLHTRDIAIPPEVDGPSSVPIPILRIGSPLGFTIESDEPGYLTVLNFGTSGRTWLQAPNAVLVPENARIEPNSTEAVPGPRTVPIALLDRARVGYVESGPAGWETLIAIVSDRPLIRDGERAHHNPRYPFREVDAHFASVLEHRLSSGDVGNWYCSIASFSVVQ